MHEIDESSPLAGLDAQNYLQADVRLFVSFEARDPTLALVVHDLRSYAPAEVMFSAHYVDMISVDTDGNTCADMTKISEVVTDEV